MAELPELNELIPSIIGDCYSYEGTTFVRPVDPKDAFEVPEHGIIRVGFRLYEVLEWKKAQGVWVTRPFSATLNEYELAELGKRRRNGK